MYVYRIHVDTCADKHTSIYVQIYMLNILIQRFILREWIMQLSGQLGGGSKSKFIGTSQ